LAYAFASQDEKIAKNNYEKKKFEKNKIKKKSWAKIACGLGIAQAVLAFASRSRSWA
jgi:hypothetical protein